MKSGTAAFMIRHCGADMDNLFSETEKLISYTGERNEITADDVRNVCSQTVAAKIFDLVGAIGKKNPEAAFAAFGDLIALKESPVMIITMIARQFRLIFQCKHLTAKGLYPDAIAKKLMIKPFVVRECISQSGNFNADTLLSALNDCLAADVAVKSGGIGDQAAVEVLIAEYAK
jgi:DNA polymerase-3 subunit delta